MLIFSIFKSGVIFVIIDIYQGGKVMREINLNDREIELLEGLITTIEEEKKIMSIIKREFKLEEIEKEIESITDIILESLKEDMKNAINTFNKTFKDLINNTNYIMLCISNKHKDKKLNKSLRNVLNIQLDIMFIDLDVHLNFLEKRTKKEYKYLRSLLKHLEIRREKIQDKTFNAIRILFKDIQIC